MRVVLDSTVLISIFSDKDKFHSDGMKIFSSIMDKKIKPIIPTLALPEICGAIRRNFNTRLAEIVENQLNTWITNEFLSIKELNLERMKLSTETAIGCNLKGADAVFVSLAKEFKAELVTFDREVTNKIKGKVKLLKF